MSTMAKQRKNVRTACVTCKKRHLKCDEGKPSCTRCTLARWPCEYVKPGPIVRRKQKKWSTGAAASLSLQRPDVLFFRTSDERANFGHFHTAGMSNTASLFVGETWWNLALRTSVYEPAVRYAVEALGLLMHVWAIQPQSRPVIPSWALARYTESLASFNNGVLCPLEQERTTIVLSLLFVTIELLCNNPDLALGHLRGGLRIAAGQKSNGSDICLLHALVHLQAQGRTHSSPTSDFNWTTMDIDLSPDEYPTTFRNNGEARNELDFISASIYSLLRSWKVATHSGELRDELTLTETELFRMKLASLNLRLSSWRRAFEELERRKFGDNSSASSIAIAVLKIQHHVMFIHLRTAFEPGESCYDAFTPQFYEIVDLAERVLDAQTYQDFSFFFSFSPLLPKLFFAAMKCRVAGLRQRLLRLLSRCPRREGFWHRDSLLQIVQWKLARESSEQDCLPPETLRIHSERIEKVDVNGDLVIRRTYKQGTHEQSEVWDVKEDADLLVHMGDVI